MKLRNTRKWAEGKPALLAAISAYFALMPQDMYGLMMSLRHLPEFRKAFPVRNPKTWLACYRRHRFVEACLIREHLGMCDSLVPPGLVRDLLKNYAETGRTPVASEPVEQVIEQFTGLGQKLSDGLWGSMEYEEVVPLSVGGAVATPRGILRAPDLLGNTLLFVLIL